MATTKRLSGPKTSPLTTLEKYKVVLVGDHNVGKTSIITRFMYDNFDTSMQPTIGIDFLTKIIHAEDRAIRLQLWDTAGQERFRCLIPAYIRDSKVAIVVYDVSNRNSFLNTRQWIEFIKDERGDEVLIFLVGNKTDLRRRGVSRKEGEKFAKERGIHFMECSAKAGTNIKGMFQKLASLLVKTVSSSEINSDSQETVIITSKSSKAESEASGTCGC